VNTRSRIWVAGCDTLLGHALVEWLRETGHDNLVGLDDEPDLAVRAQVEDFVAEMRPEFVFVAAGKSGGIGLNRERPAELMLDNLLVAAHVIDAVATNGVRKLLYLTSSCSYPRDAAQPLRVESLMTGTLEPTNTAYATAKLAGWQLCRAYRQQFGVNCVTAIPANAFGPHDDFDPRSGHVIPALIARCETAKRRHEPTLTIWGTGTPRREFVFARDLADACVFVMRHYDDEAPINLGGSASLSISEVAHAIADVVGYHGKLVFDATKPDGMPLKMLDSSPLRQMGWRPTTDFRTALTETYHWFLQHEVMEDHEHDRSTVPSAVAHPSGRGGDRPHLSDR
jgi:GDP-L-fucose synthase